MERVLRNVEHEVFVTPPTDLEGLPGIVDRCNFIIDKFMCGSWTHLWLIQADVTVPPDAFVKLYSLDVDVAQGFVPGHENFNRLVCGYMDENKKVWYLPRNAVKDMILSGWVFAGLSCTLIKRRVFESGIRFRLQPGVGEDILFLYDVQSRGFVAKVHGGVECGHLPEWPLATYIPNEVRRHEVFGVLDVGCGHQPKGDVNVDLHRKATAHRTVEQLSDSEDVQLNVKDISNFVRADACYLPFVNGSFEQVFSSHVLEHVSEPDLMVAEMLRVTDRWVEVHVPHPDLKRAYGVEKPLHRNKITRRWLEEHLKGYDFQIREESSQGVPFELVALIDKGERDLNG